MLVLLAALVFFLDVELLLITIPLYFCLLYRLVLRFC